MAEYITYPLNEIDYDASDAQLYTATRRHGVYANDHFNATVTGVDNNVTIAPGIAWASPSEWGGVVFASKTPVLVSLPLADPSQPRYDLITIKFNASTGFEGEISYTEGTPSSNPQIPPVSQNSNIFELGLFSVYRPVGATTITAAHVGDLRIDDAYCGLMRDGVTGIDTSVFNAQALALIEELREVIAEVIDGSEYLLKTEYDPQSKGIDITNQEYTHTALNTLTGTGANGYFTAAFSGNVTEINGLTVKVGADTGIDLEVGTVYWFTIVGNTLNIVGSNGKDVYSSTEVKTSKVWVDGKPIYRRIIETTDAVIPLNMPIENITHVEVRNMTSGILFFNSFVNSDLSGYFAFAVEKTDENNCFIQTRGSSSINTGTKTITVEYTKN